MKSIVILTAALSFALPAAAQPRDEKPSADPRTEQMNRDKNNQTAKDAALTGKVHTALAADVGLKTLKINVDSDKGVVTLKGRVDTADTKRRAEEVARKVNGVTSVKNELQVRG